MKKYKTLGEFYEDCELWEKRLTGSCCTIQEQKVMSNAFFRLRDRFSCLEKLEKEDYEA